MFQTILNNCRARKEGSLFLLEMWLRSDQKKINITQHRDIRIRDVKENAVRGHSPRIRDGTM